MTLLTPSLFVLGACSVAVPIIIHLLNRRKFERVDWAAMRFLAMAVEQNQRRIQVEDILLLILRCLLLLLLGLALAQWVVRSASAGIFGQSPVTGVIIIDNSYSMSATDGVKSRFDQAKAAAEQVIDSLPSGSRVAVIMASDKADAIIAQPTRDLNLARKKIEQASLTDRSTELWPSLRMAIDTLSSPAMRKEIYVITDGQMIAWSRLTEIKQALGDAARPGSDIRSHLILVGSPLDDNLGVSDLRLASDWAMVDRPLRFEATITNYGKNEAHDVSVKLHVDGDPPSDQGSIQLLKPGESQTVQLTAKLRDAGFHTVTAELPPDRLPADDRRTIAVHGLDKVNVLLVNGQTGRTPQENELNYVKQMLQPVPLAQQDTYFIHVTSIDTAGLVGVRLTDYDTVVLGDVAELPQKTLDQLANYLRGGGGLIVFPGPNALLSFYNQQLVQKYHILPAELGTAVGQADQDTAYYTFRQEQHFGHPIAQVWNAPGAGSPTDAHFFRAYPLIPDPNWVPLHPADHQKNAGVVDQLLAEAGQPSTVLAYGHAIGNVAGGSLDASPAIMERTWGRGKVILFSSTASTRWNDVADHPGIFAPLIYRSLGAVVQRQDEALNVKIGEGKFVYDLPEDFVGRDVHFSSPGHKTTLDVRKVELVEGQSGAAATVSYDQTDVAGEYEAVVSGDPPLKIKFAAQPDNRESNLRPLPPAQLKELSEVASVLQWTPGTQLTAIISKQQMGSEMWLPLTIAVLCLAVTETFLGQWFSRVK